MTSDMVGSSRTEISIGRILRCHQCLFGFCEMAPSETELVALYRDMDTRLYNDESKGRAKIAQAHLDIVQSNIERKGRLLDVGCASGLFLRHAMESGWEVVGVEPSEELCREAQTLLGEQARVHLSTLQSIQLAQASFDVITLWDVLEHVPDPVSFLERCMSLLKPSGCLFANVPDLDSLQSRMLGSRWPLLLPEHLNYFNQASLKMCGQRAGLRWIASCRCPATLTIDYILYRLGQHKVPCLSHVRRLAIALGLDHRLLSIYLGEICGIWMKEENENVPRPFLDSHSPAQEEVFR